MEASDIRDELRARWERAAAGWGRRAEQLLAQSMPISVWLIEHLSLQPGERVLELAAGPGDTGFFAAELIAPGGKLVTSDGSEEMLEVARRRASEKGIDNVEFAQLELEWIDLATASVDAVLCRWGVMLCADPMAALQEIRRVLKPGGRVALAVWDIADLNPWATIPTRTLIELGRATPPDPNAPGMFALAAPGQLEDMLSSAGFVEVQVESVDLDRIHPSPRAYLEEILDLSRPFADVYERLGTAEQAEVERKLSSLVEAYKAADGSLRLPGRSLVAAASA